MDMIENSTQSQEKREPTFAITSESLTDDLIVNILSVDTIPGQQIHSYFLKNRDQYIGYATFRSSTDNPNDAFELVINYLKTKYVQAIKGNLPIDMQNLINQGDILIGLEIDEKYRGKGYGKKIMDFALNDLKEKGVKEVAVGDSTMTLDNEQTFYERNFPTKRGNGFTLIDLTKL
jgi:GNAT superfamily N-acetyltransferase